MLSQKNSPANVFKSLDSKILNQQSSASKIFTLPDTKIQSQKNSPAKIVKNPDSPGEEQFCSMDEGRDSKKLIADRFWKKNFINERKSLNNSMSMKKFAR